MTKEFEIEVLVTFKKFYILEADDWEEACEVAEDNIFGETLDPKDEDCSIETYNCVRLR